jgi:4-methyl-5(b-hydroxyethyl)-thiazole monophosphate biosynthesis
MRLFALAFLALGKQSQPFSLPLNRHLFSTSSTALNMSKRVLVPIADGSEEIETTCITDTLTRFGARVTVASVKPGGDLLCTMSRGIKIMADVSIDDAAKEEYDLVVLPGGMPGAEHLRDSKMLISILQKQKAAGKRYAAICAAPAVALASHGLVGEKVRMEEQLEQYVSDKSSSPRTLPHKKLVLSSFSGYLLSCPSIPIKTCESC